MLIENIPTDTFNRIVDHLKSDGWACIDEYDNMDAWIDYGMVRFQRNADEIVLEWTNWDEGSIDGAPEIVTALAQHYNLT